MNQSETRPAIIVDPYSSGAMYAEAFKNLGVETIAVMSAKKPPDVYAPSFRPDDFNQIIVANDDEIPELISTLRALDPSCILTGCESGVELTDRIAPMVLPGKSNPPETANARRHKGEMADALIRAGVPCMRQICTNSVDEVADWISREDLSGKDLVIKPPKSASTDGVQKIVGGAGWRNAFSTLVGTVNRLGYANDTLVVQEFLSGVEYAVDTASYDGMHSVASICRYNKVDNGPFMAIYDTMEWMSEEFDDSDVLKNYAKCVLDAVGMQFGTSHVEIMITENGPYLIEIGARPHGGGHPQFCRQATGDSQIDQIVRSFVNNGLTNTNYELKTNLTVVFLLCKENGVVQNRKVLDQIPDLTSFHYSRIHIRQGDTLKPTEDLFASLELGFVVLSHESQEQIRSDTLAIREWERQLFDLKDTIDLQAPRYADGIPEFIDQCDNIMHGEYHKLPVSDQRGLYEKLAAHFNGPIPGSVKTSETTFIKSGIERKFRVYRNTDNQSSSMVYYIRGGGFVLGSLETHNVLLAELCAETGLTIIAPDFRLAPEHPYPAAIDDCEDIYTYVVDNAESLGIEIGKTIVSGDSSGGGMAVALCMRLREYPLEQFDGMVLFNPVLDFTRWKDGGEDAPLLTGGEMEFYTRCYAPDDAVFNPEVSPLITATFEDIPPTYVMAAELDSLKEDSINFVAKLKEKGIAAELVIENGLVHGAIRARGLSGTAMAAFKRGCTKLVELTQ